MRVDPRYYIKRICRTVLLALTAIVLLKCLIFPNALDVLILVGLLLVLMGALAGKCC